MRRTAGFTLVELLIVVGILGLVVAGLLGTFTTQQRTYAIVDQTVEAQQIVRIVADLIERDLHLAGYLVPEAAAVCGWDRTNGPDTLFVSNTDVLRTVDQLPVDEAAGNLGAPVSGVGPGWVHGAAITLSRNWLDVAADGPDFAANAGVIVLDRNDPDARVACGVVTALAGNTLSVDWNGTQIGPVGANPDVVAIPAHVYQVNAPGGATPQLQRDGMALAQDIEDLQVAYFFDDDDDRNLGPDEMYGDGVDAAGGVDTATYDPSLANGQNLREVRFNLVAVSRDPDPRQEYVQGLPQAFENRALGAAVPDRFHRRTHTATVRVRNVGNS